MSGGPAAEIGVFGGSGFYALLDAVEDVTIETPYGPPSDPIAIGSIGGRSVAFLPRHGRDHRHPPHRIPYRANLWAMRALGVRRIVGPCAAGSLRADIEPGSFVVCDQFVDRTTTRPHTFYDDPPVTHVTAAEPYCPSLRALLTAGAAAAGLTVHDRGTMVVIEGPRFATRAESRWYAALGGDVINMTGYPEGWLARELGICYANVSLITDYDAGVDRPGAGATSAEILAAFSRSNDRLRDLLFAVIPEIDAPAADDPCRAALDDARL